MMPRVLILDDDATFLYALTALIRDARTDISVDTALCAEAGLLLIAVSTYDLIISDFHMSGLDGLRLVKECKRLRPGTPIVLITGYGDRNMEAQALHSGAYAFVHKPVPPDIFLSLVDRAIRIVKEPASCKGHQDCAAPSDPVAIERERLLKKVHEIDRLIQEQLGTPGNDTVH